MKNNFEKLIYKYREIKDYSTFYLQLSSEDLKKLPNHMSDEAREVKQELDNLKIKIREIPKDVVYDYKKNLINGINKVLKLIDKSNSSYPISRDQSMVIDNYIYGKIRDIIGSTLKTRNGVGWSPIYRTTDSSDAFDKERVKKLLSKYKKEITNSEFENYFQLEEKAEELLDKIGDLWKEDNEKIYH